MASVHQRYRILSKLDAGGMAEIYRGVAISIEGFEKPVAIKRILPSLCQNQKFVTMFLDEARLSMQLNHANIVQIFDLGQVGDTYFVAMEMVEGANLRRVMQRSVDMGLHIPVPIGCFLIMETAKALAYAHEKTGPNDQPLGIVHRDVSPPNVLLSRQGEVKLTDFGLARAATNAQVTDQGVVKGKYAYLSPEAADGKPVDPRADIYSCGIILWELLCGRRLFAGKSDPDTVELVRQGVIPKPSSVRPEVDEELERIVLRALAKNVKRRYQSARELEQDLAAYLFKNNLRVTGNDLAAFLRLTAGEGQLGESQVDIGALLRAELDELARVGRLDMTLGQVPLKPSDLHAQSTSTLGVAGLLERLNDVPLDDLADDASMTVSLAERLEGLAEASKSGSKTVGKPQRLRRWAYAAAAAAVVLLAAVAVWIRG
jgi:serine/threonine protein kinase